MQGELCKFLILFINPDSGVPEACWIYPLPTRGSDVIFATLSLLPFLGLHYFMIAFFAHLLNLTVSFGWTLASCLVLDTEERTKHLYIVLFMKCLTVCNDSKKRKHLPVTILECMDIISSVILVLFKWCSFPVKRANREGWWKERAKAESLGSWTSPFITSFVGMSVI